MRSDAALWHEVECGGYEADLSLWRDLALRHEGPVLDVGAGSGRVALALVAEGHEVVALDNDTALLDELSRRAGEAGLPPIETVCVDAREYVDAARFGLVIVPMQTVQLMGGPAGRARFLACAHASLRPGGGLAVAVADLSAGSGTLPATYPPDRLQLGESTYESRPTCVRQTAEGLVIERARSRTDGREHQSLGTWSQEIDRVDPSALEGEARQVGFSIHARLAVPPSGAYAGSEVVLLGR